MIVESNWKIGDFVKFKYGTTADTDVFRYGEITKICANQWKSGEIDVEYRLCFNGIDYQHIEEQYIMCEAEIKDGEEF